MCNKGELEKLREEPKEEESEGECEENKKERSEGGDRKFEGLFSSGKVGEEE